MRETLTSFEPAAVLLPGLEHEAVNAVAITATAAGRRTDLRMTGRLLDAAVDAPRSHGSVTETPCPGRYPAVCFPPPEAHNVVCLHAEWLDHVGRTRLSALGRRCGTGRPPPPRDGSYRTGAPPAAGRPTPAPGARWCGPVTVEAALASRFSGM
ncbi:hypothetical protein GCM10010293_39330 [Streptomyces griseoflavus]|nr:hypothetical protein GCM10010293_39330 [Streptomyces griseoflavus]